VQRLRFSSNMADSAKAVFAADAGIECELYRIFKDPSVDCNVLIFDDALTTISTSLGSIGAINYIKSTGTSNKSKRAFYLSY